jgi:hypothetical protein
VRSSADASRVCDGPLETLRPQRRPLRPLGRGPRRRPPTSSGSRQERDGHSTSRPTSRRMARGDAAFDTASACVDARLQPARPRSVPSLSGIGPRRAGSYPPHRRPPTQQDRREGPPHRPLRPLGRGPRRRRPPTQQDRGESPPAAITGPRRAPSLGPLFRLPGQGDRGPGRRPVAVRWNGSEVRAGSGPNVSFQGTRESRRRGVRGPLTPSIPRV